MSDMPVSEMSPGVDAVKTTMLSAVGASATVTSYCHALKRAKLSAPKIPVEWFDELQKSLGVAQLHAATWIEQLQPALFANVPEAIIGYGDVFRTCTSQVLKTIEAVLSSSPLRTLTDAERRKILQVLNRVLESLGDRRTDLLQLQARLQEFVAQVQEDHTKFASAARAAEREGAANAEKLKLIRQKIGLIKEKINAANKNQTAGNLSMGVGLFVMVVAIGLTMATGGIAAPLAIAVGVVTVGAGLAMSIQSSREIARDTAELNALCGSLSAAEAFAIWIEETSSVVRALCDANEAAARALSDILAMWETLRGKLEAVIEAIQHAEKPAIAERIKKLNISVSIRHWEDLVAYAEQMQRTTFEVKDVRLGAKVAA